MYSVHINKQEPALKSFASFEEAKKFTRWFTCWVIRGDDGAILTEAPWYSESEL